MSRRRTAAVLATAAATLAFAAPPVPGSDGLVPGARTADAPLVAEAGESAFVSPGDHAVLLGTAFGGTGEYEVAWSTEAGTVEDPTNPTGAIDTTGLDAGTYTATLEVTDGDATATDTAHFVVAGGGAGEQTTLLDQTASDTEPGVFATDSAYEWTVEVPEGIGQLDVSITWDVPANDYDLSVLDPSGTEQGASGSAPPATTEATGVSNPESGTWTVRALRYATVSDPSLRAVVTATTGAGDDADPRPTLDTTGPYEFVLGEAQRVQADVAGGTGQPHVGWDTDLNGVADDATGTGPELDLPVGRHLVTAVVTDEAGLERRETTSVTVGRDADHLRELAVPFTVIGIADSGINPYHAEYSAATYPDPEVLELTRNFTRHPSEYIEGYPADAQALPATTGEGYFPEKDQYLWSVGEDESGTVAGDYVDTGELHWIPGTKIIGAIDAGGSTGVTSGDDTHPILDDNGHGTGSTSVSAGNRYGYCPTCLIVLVEALDESVVAEYPWVDISSNSFGAVGGVPLGLALGADEPTKQAAERGQLTLFSAGNGTGNAFATTPILTYGGSPNGADWVLSIGATREDNQGAIVSDGYPVHISALGDGDLPSACRTGDTGQCAFGGTSAASPYTAGAFGRILTEVREALGDTGVGQRPGQVVATGTPIPDSPFLDDGELTRAELRTVGLKTALPRGQGQGPDLEYPFPWTWEGDGSVYFEGYGSAGPAHAERAIAVLLGEVPLPDRTEADAFFAQDCEHRDSLYGSYDRDGDGEPDPCSEAAIARYVGDGPAENVDPTTDHFDAAREQIGAGDVLTEPITYYLHRQPRFEPDREPVPVTEDPSTAGDPGDVLETDVCAESDNEQFMSRENTDDDVDVCFDNRATSLVAAFRPKGIFTATDNLEAALPAGSTVTATIHMQSSDVPVTSLEGVLKATDREVGRSEAVAGPAHPGGWTSYELELTTDRLVAAGEQLTFHLVHAGARSWAYGYNGDHASSITITPAAAPEAGNEFGVTIDPVEADDTAPAGVTVSGRVAVPDLGEDPQLAGFHPRSVDVQVSTDADFSRAVYAAVDPDSGTWTATLPGEVEMVHARALRDRVPSPVATASVGTDDQDDDGGGDGGGDENRRDRGGDPPGRGHGRGDGNPGQGGGQSRPADGDAQGPGADEEVTDADVPAEVTASMAQAQPVTGADRPVRDLLAVVAFGLLLVTLTSLGRVAWRSRGR